MNPLPDNDLSLTGLGGCIRTSIKSEVLGRPLLRGRHSAKTEMKRTTTATFRYSLVIEHYELGAMELEHLRGGRIW